ncbi:MAG TPA: hypothetical protein VFU65_22885 [Actinocrinis sp.]|nr:hypothetical protein [Actinocrinis sp.]
MRIFRITQRLAIGVSALALVATTAACSSSSSGSPNAAASAAASATAGMTGMAGMGMEASDPMYSGTGLSASDGGFTFTPATTSLAAAVPATLNFKILGASGAALTSFVPDQTKLMHFYLIRTDLTGYQHVHPVMASDGTWSASLATLTPGSYRAYAAFNAKNAAGTTVAEVLSRTLTVPGHAATSSLPAAATSTGVDGYTLTVSGELMAAMNHTLTITVSKNGKPVTDLQPYLETYAHLTAIHAGDLAFAHLHPQGAAAMTDAGGPTLAFQTMLPAGGDWRFFIQFQTGGLLHTAAITLHVD